MLKNTQIKKSYFINFETKGGIKQYFDELVSEIGLEEKKVVVYDRPSADVLQSLTKECVTFNGVSKQFFCFILKGGRPSLILHDPKLRKGFTFYELAYFILLLLLHKRINSCILHSEPSYIVRKLFKFNILRMPSHNLKSNVKIKILFFGRVEEYKAIHKYVEMFENNSRVQLIIAGKVSNKIKKCFNFCKNVEVYDLFFSDWMLRNIIVSSDYILLPYDDVTNTNIHLQAFREKKPVIRTDLSYFESNIPILKSLVFKKGDVAGLENLIQKIPSPYDSEYKKMLQEINDYWLLVNDEKGKSLQDIINLIATDCRKSFKDVLPKITGF